MPFDDLDPLILSFRLDSTRHIREGRIGYQFLRRLCYWFRSSLF